MNKEKDKTLEEFFEEILMAFWAVIHFSIMPVKAKSLALAVLENLIRSLIFYSLFTGGLWLFCFAFEEEYYFNHFYLLHFFIASALFFSLRHWLFLYSFKTQTETKKITTQDLNFKKLKKLGSSKTSSKFSSLMKDKNKAPIGLSLISKKPVFLDLNSRLQHAIISGATGQGKTTFLKTLLSHSLKHNHPIIIIDPKGEKEDILEMKQRAELYNREKDFYLFSLSFPGESVSYNPLSNGTSEQIKARLMDGLNFEHEYYKAQAGLWLGAVLYALEVLEESITFSTLRELISSKQKLRALQKEINKLKGPKHKERLKSGLSSAFKIKEEDLAGLSSQISSIDSAVWTDILSPKASSHKTKLSLSNVLEHKKIAYFQMNVNGYGDISRRIGKMILQDLKVLSNQIQAGQKSFNYNFCACFVDEFGSFATNDFADFLKMARSSRISIHLFCQGLADLKAVSPEFKDQIVGNTSTKIIFRQDVPKDAETWSGIAGTFSSKKKTYQVIGMETEEQMTGMGSLREVKEMRIEFDVFKKLSVGQAVLIDKSCHKEDLLSVWEPERALLERSREGRLGLLKRLLSAFKAGLSMRKALSFSGSKLESLSLKPTQQEQDRLRLEWEKQRLSVVNLTDEEWESKGL
ncbi:MAG: TraM recognition domain-containing protein [Oligoflexia bacterium]|nr:TraM recognition domain-containing protein [Oligoflexia bacterium]